MDLPHSRELVQRPEAAAGQTSRGEASSISGSGWGRALILTGAEQPLCLGQAALPPSRSAPGPWDCSGAAQVHVGTLSVMSGKPPELTGGASLPGDPPLPGAPGHTL